jgi:hypothetical protein
MRDVLVETNWVVGWAAPSHRAAHDAAELLERAVQGALRLHVPAIALTEGRATIRRKYQPREADAIRTFLKASSSTIALSDMHSTLRVLDTFESRVRRELDALDGVLEGLRRMPNVHVFPLDTAALERAVELASLPLDLQPFDQAILAAVLTHGQRLRDAGATAVCFCELDADLQPWTKDGVPKRLLASLYEQAGIEVYPDFESA